MSDHSHATQNYNPYGETVNKQKQNKENQIKPPFQSCVFTNVGLVSTSLNS